MLIDDTKPLSEQRHPFFGPTADDWNLDLDDDDPDHGKPGVGIVAAAISVWSMLNGTVTIGDVAAAFKMPADAVAQCVEYHPWMFFIGDENTPLEQLVLEHEGE